MSLADDMREESLRVIDTEALWTECLGGISESAREGKRNYLVCYTDCQNSKTEYLCERATKEGFKVRTFRENFNGIWQYPGIYICW